MDSKSYRKPYIRPVKASWWTKNHAYIKYFFREQTALFSFWCAAELLTIAVAAALLRDNAQPWIASFLQNPVVITINILSLPAVFFHTWTWYRILPIGVRAFISKNPADTRMIPRTPVTVAFWCITCVASALIFWALI